MQPLESRCTANFYAILFFIEVALKLSYFCKKIQNFRALGVLPSDPQNSPTSNANFRLRIWLKVIQA